MELYHFTARQFVSSIAKHGLTMGVLPRTLGTTNGKRIVGAQKGWQWLTQNPDFGGQAWQEFGSLPYKRNEFRFTVRIPERAKGNLIHWLTYSRRFDDPLFDDLNLCGNPEHWFLYHGLISPDWLVHVDVNPVVALTSKSDRFRIIKRRQIL